MEPSGVWGYQASMQMGVEPKIGVGFYPPKMDGENHGKPY